LHLVLFFSCHSEKIGSNFLWVQPHFDETLASFIKQSTQPTKGERKNKERGLGPKSGSQRGKGTHYVLEPQGNDGGEDNEVPVMYNGLFA